MKRFILVTLCATLFFAPAAQAQTDGLFVPDQVDQFWWETEKESEECTNSGAGTTGDTDPDPAAIQTYEETIAPLVELYAPLYQQAAEAENLADWQILAGLHWMETGLSKQNPTGNPGFRGVFQMSATGLRGGGFDPLNGTFEAGRQLTDDEFVEQAQAAIRLYIRPKANVFDIDISQPLSVEDASTITIAYKSGEGSVWLAGGADPNLHAYTWAGYDQSPEHALPMAYGPGSPYGDEETTDVINKPGALLVWALAKENISEAGGDQCANPPGTFEEITGSHDELVERLLSNEKTAEKPDGHLVLGVLSSRDAQIDDITNALTDTMLKAMIALVEQSGVDVGINVFKTGHRPGSLHELGRAVDINYYGTGDACRNNPANTTPDNCDNPDGIKLFQFILDNAEGLHADELIWQDPPEGTGCLDQGGEVDCYDFFGLATMNEHYHHIHFGVLD